jgi:hypothetical protein
MVPARDVAVEEQPVQDGFTHELNTALFDQLAPQRLQKRLSGLDPAARQVPAGHIAVLDQEYAIVPVDHHRADPERHATGKAPVEVENAPQNRLKTFPQVRRIHLNQNSIAQIPSG